MALLFLSSVLGAQTNDTSQVPRGSYAGPDTKTLSDLARDNLDYVAASSIQIREVLAKDAGLLVELKRYVAKEASDNGQVVQESMLSDQAIFARLDRDIRFRSVATRLLQRYGYLLPSANPDSNYAKEQDYVLKERARRLVQIEAEEDAASLKPGNADQNERDVERTSCDEEHDPNCERPRAPRPYSNAPVKNTRTKRDNDQSLPPDTRPVLAAPRTLQTDLLAPGVPVL